MADVTVVNRGPNYVERYFARQAEKLAHERELKLKQEQQWATGVLSMAQLLGKDDVRQAREYLQSTAQENPELFRKYFSGKVNFADTAAQTATDAKANAIRDAFSNGRDKDYITNLAATGSSITPNVQSSMYGAERFGEAAGREAFDVSTGQKATADELADNVRADTDQAFTHRLNLRKQDFDEKSTNRDFGLRRQMTDSQIAVNQSSIGVNTAQGDLLRAETDATRSGARYGGSSAKVPIPEEERYKALTRMAAQYARGMAGAKGSQRAASKEEFDKIKPQLDAAYVEYVAAAKRLGVAFEKKPSVKDLAAMPEETPNDEVIPYDQLGSMND
ncbi:MAG: hypothetical protein ACTHQM_25810 [Thermoanaerobaculia bacterium]